MKSHMDLPEIDAATGKRKELYDRIQAERGKGNISSVFQAYGTVPEVGMQNFEAQNTLLDSPRLSRIFKVALMVAMSELNKSDPCISCLGTLVKKMGATDEEIMETLVTVNTVHNFNLITCATGGGKEPWYTYNMEDFEPEKIEPQESPVAAE